MRTLKRLFDNNQAWAARMRAGDSQFFDRLSRQQSPEYLWIGCSDSRVPANEIVGLLPGELFVHRNVANLVNHTDLNCLSVLQYAVEALRVRHIIVCGHYGCGGVQAAVRNDRLGLIDNWLRRVQEVQYKHGQVLDGLIDESQVLDRMCELNIIEQVYNVSRTTVVEDAWWHGQSLTIHGWIYSLKDGLLHDLGMCVSRKEEVAESYANAVSALKVANGGVQRSAPLHIGTQQLVPPANAPNPASAKQTAPTAPPPSKPAPRTERQAGEPPPLPPLK